MPTVLVHLHRHHTLLNVSMGPTTCKEGYEQHRKQCLAACGPIVCLVLSHPIHWVGLPFLAATTTICQHRCHLAFQAPSLSSHPPQIQANDSQKGREWEAKKRCRETMADEAPWDFLYPHLESFQVPRGCLCPTCVGSVSILSSVEKINVRASDAIQINR